jgi:hypothetical protein
MLPTFTPFKTATVAATFKVNTPNPTLDPNGGDAASGDSAIIAGTSNKGAGVAIGILLPISVIVIIVFGFLILRDRRGGGGGDAMAVHLQDSGEFEGAGSYTF